MKIKRRNKNKENTKKAVKGKRELNFKYNWKIYLSFLKNYKLLFSVIVFTILINEILNISERYLFKIIIDKSNDYGAKTINLDVLINILIWIAIIYIGFILIKSLFKWLTIHMQNRLEVKMITDLKEKFFNHIVNLSHSFHTSHKTGSMISRINRGSGAMERMTDFLTYNIFPPLFQFSMAAVSLIYISFTSGIIIFVTMVVFMVYSVYMQNVQRIENHELNRIEDIEKANLADIMINIDSIKFYGKEDLIKQKYKMLINRTKNSLLKFWDYGRWMSSFQNLILWGGVLVLIYFSMKDYLAGSLTLGDIVFIYSTYGTLMYGYVWGFMNGLRGYYRSMTDFHDLFEYGKIEQEVKDNLGAKTLIINKGGIKFENVGFKYNEKYIFKNFNLEIKPGEKVALVGHSGSGKSTLVKLLYRLYDVTAGRILIDNQNVKDVKQESLRSELSIVPQECILFDNTVFENIKFSNTKASKKDVMNAIKLAQLDKTVKNFPYKEKTIVGERGVKLSGGEKQRVSISRAILANKRVIILDEATSSLDSKTEHEIQDALKHLLKGRTSIIIAHRLSTIMNADKIVVLDKGKIVQIGKHNDLIRKKGAYRELWNLQKGGYLQE